MTGLIKPKNYDWKDSNLALFGSDIEKLIKKESATKEPAWRDAGRKVGLQIWRIVDFVVTSWKKQDYGKFFNGDSYIILNTYNPSPDSEELAFDVHFWIGSRSTQDEYGTAAYKTVELDTFLDGRPVQHREVEGFESDLFRTYFPRGLTIMEGGADTGFNHVQPTKYEPRLFHFSGTRRDIVVREVPRARSRLVSDDVFILDLGLKMYQWNGRGSNKDERFKALQYLAQLKSDRGKAVSDTLEEEDTPPNHEFYAALTGADEVDQVALAFIMATQKRKPVTKLYRLAEQGHGNLELTKVKEGKLSKSDFDSNDVFLVDTGRECFVWLGKGTSPNEVQNGFGIAHNLLMKSDHPLVPISVIREGQDNRAFHMALAA
jgi:gelsolin